MKQTYKQDLLGSIDQMFDRTTIDRLPRSLLNDLSTAHLVEFRRWLLPIIEEKPKARTTRLLGPGPKKTRGP